jgi:hypothetical protein
VRPESSQFVRIVIWALLATVLLAAFWVAGTAVVLPSCGLCHATASFAKATAASPHADVACSACHTEPGVVARAELGFREVLHLVGPVGGSTGTYSASVSDARCVSCHEKIYAGVSDSGGIRIAHKTCAKGASCTDCHAEVAHGTATKWNRSYDMDRCLHCHGQAGSIVKCDTCHTKRTTEDRISRGPWAVTHGPDWRKTHGMGDQFTCSACHPAGFCDKCHGPGLPHGASFIQAHPTAAVKPGSKCQSCHDKVFCTGCHGLQMPHPEGFKAAHADLARKDGDKLCRSCHSERDCTQCHVMHVHPGGASLEASVATVPR